MKRPLPRPALRGLALALALVVAGGSSAQAGEPVMSYTVTAKDTLIGLGRSLLVDGASWPEVARLNALRNPNLITPGQVLQVPLRLLRSAQVAAQVLSVEGDVRLDGKPVKAGDALPQGQMLQTAAASSAVLLLGDGSRIKVAPLTETGLDEHRRFDIRPNAVAGEASEGLFASTMRLVRGSIEVLASKVRRAKPLEVTTPTAVIGVRGTEYRVHAQAARSGTEVLEGKVRADAKDAEGTDVPAGFGAVLLAGVAPAVVALPPAPDLSGVPARFDRPLVRFATPAQDAQVRVQVAADDKFERLVRDLHVAAGSEVRIAGLDDGSWRMRVRRVDARGVEGYDAQRAFTLKARPEPPAAMGPRAAAKMSVGAVSVAWAENLEATRYHLQVAKDAAFTDPVLDADALQGAKTELKLDQAGVYHWRLASVRASGDQGPWGDAQVFELRPLPEPPAGGLGADGKSLALNWSGRPQDKQQVELASDEAFTQVLARETLTQAQWLLPTPKVSGKLYFRYRSVETDGFTTPWSSTLVIEIPRNWSFLWLLAPLLLAL
jgi:hypothetical protein